MVDPERGLCYVHPCKSYEFGNHVESTGGNCLQFVVFDNEGHLVVGRVFLLVGVYLCVCPLCSLLFAS